MKKILIGIMAVLYMTVSSGIAMEIHYCMGKQAGVEFYGSDSDKCGKCGMTEKKGGCCSDEYKFYKLGDAHKNVFNELNFTTAFIAVTHDYPSYTIQQPAEVIAPELRCYSPPGDTGVPLHVLNCVFRI